MPLTSFLNQKHIQSISESRDHLHVLGRNYYVSPPPAEIGEVSSLYYRIKKSNFAIEKQIEMNKEEYGRVIFSFSDAQGGFTLTKFGGERTRLRSLKIGLLDPDVKMIGMIDLDFMVRDDDEIITRYEN